MPALRRSAGRGPAVRGSISPAVAGLMLVLLSAIGLVVGTATASAHAVLERTDPAMDAVLARRPGQVSLTFGESVQLPAHAVRVYDSSGAEIDAGAPFHPSGRPETVAVALTSGVGVGSYTVAWRVVSADTHPVSGAFVFSVGHRSASAVPAAPPGGSLVVGGLYALVRAAAFVAYALLVGASTLVTLCWPVGPIPGSVIRVARLGWSASLLTTVATLLLQGPYGSGTGLDDLLDPGTVATTLELSLGAALAARLLLLAVYAFYLSYLTHRLPAASVAHRRALTAVGLVLAAALAATWSTAGHAAVGAQPAIAQPVDMAHLVSLAAWLGGVVALGFALHRDSRTGRHLSATSVEPEADDQLQVVAAAFRRFSNLAPAYVGIVVVTGTYQAWRQLGSLAALVDTTYGRLLDLKLAAVAATLVAASYSRRTVQRIAPSHQRLPSATAAVGVTGGQGSCSGPPITGRAERQQPGIATLRRSLLAEVVAASAVFMLTAALVNAQPGRTALAQAARAPGPVRATINYDSGGGDGQGSLEIEVDPARPGPNTISVVVRGSNAAPQDVAELGATLSLMARHIGPLRIPVVHHGIGRYTASASIPLHGVWQLALTVRTSEFDETTMRLPLDAS